MASRLIPGLLGFFQKHHDKVDVHDRRAEQPLFFRLSETSSTRQNHAVIVKCHAKKARQLAGFFVPDDYAKRWYTA